MDEQTDYDPKLLIPFPMYTFQVRFGWEQKKEQLDLLYEILHRPEYKNVTGLAEVLNVYLEEQYDILDEEDIKLKQEEDEVAYERKR